MIVCDTGPLVDYERMAELVETYDDFPLGTTDAAIVAVAERLGVSDVATLDRRHFHAVRPSHTGSFHPPALIVWSRGAAAFAIGWRGAPDPGTPGGWRNQDVLVKVLLDRVAQSSRARRCSCRCTRRCTV